MSFAPTAAPGKSPAIGHNRGGFTLPPGNDGGGENPGGGASPDYGQRLRRARLGLLFAAAPILMLFLTFSVVYVVRLYTPAFDEHNNSYVRYWIRLPLPAGLLMINTIILLVSSLTIDMARRRIGSDVALAPVRLIPGVAVGRERALPWLVATAFLGIAFLFGQGLAWRELLARGFDLSSSASSSFVYLLTATHAVHLAGGILVLLYALVIYFLRRPVESRHIVVDVTAWYWHFMFFLWISIFALLELAR